MNKKSNEFHRLIILLLGLAGLSACGTPFSTNIYKYNDDDPQEAAVISVSDPQIYARETLINDRLIERKLLNDLLDESQTRAFRNEIGRPSMIRDLETLDALRLAADLSYDPGKGGAARRTEELADLDHRIAVAKKEQRLQEILEGPGTDADQPEDDEQDPEPGDDSNEEPPPNNDPEGGGDDEEGGGGGGEGDGNEENAKSGDEKDGDSKPEPDNTKSGNAARLDAVAARLGKRVVQMPIPEAERARDAYRSELRHRLNALSLDDLHDYNGNSLYRMQFRATVIPGRHKDKYGVARFTFMPPILDDTDLDSLYRTWLLHLANRLNSPFPEVRNLCPEPVGSYLRLERSDVVKFQQIKVSWKWQTTNLTDTESNQTDTEANQNSTRATKIEVMKSDAKSTTEIFSEKTDPEVKDRFCTIYVPLHPKGSINSLEGIQILAVIAALNRDNRTISAALTETINHYSTNPNFATSNPNAPTRFKELLKRGGGYGERGLKGKANNYPDFQKAIDEMPGGSNAKRATGAAYAYSVSPLEKAQTISTQARTARSFEMALSLVASLPTAGVGGSLDLKRVRESAGIIEAFENQAIVIGFAERRGILEKEKSEDSTAAYKVDVQSPQVGWLFGPKVRINAEKSELQLIHGYASHEVSADLSIPGWWPRVDAILETAWIGNTFDSGRPIRLDDEGKQGFHRERFKVELPLNSADLDGLTEFIAGKLVGSSLPATAIQHVEPYYISACSSDFKVLIKGPNVWRSATAFLGGVEADEISILPDMEGIAASFNLDKMFSLRNESTIGLGLAQNVLLTIWTRNGSDQMALRLIGNRKSVKGKPESCIAPTSVSATTQPNRFEIIDVSPTQICQEWTEAHFLVKTVHVRNQRIWTLFGNKSVDATRRDGYGKNSIYEVSIKGGPFTKQPTNTVLTMSSGDDISSWPVRIVACDKSPPKPTRSMKPSKVLNTVVVADPSDTSNYSFEIALDDIDKSYFAGDLGASLRIGVLPKNEAAGGRWIASNTEPVFSVGTYKAAFKVAKGAANNPALAFSEPQELRVALFRLINGTHSSLTELKSGPVYFPTEADASVKISDGPKDLTKDASEMVLEFPWWHQKAYPALAKSQLSAEVTGQSAIKLVVSTDLSKIDKDRKVKATIKLADDSSETAWKQLSGDQTIQLQLKGTNQSLPKVAPLTINKGSN